MYFITDDFSVVHQSEGNYCLPPRGTIPLYCVASHHSLSYVYERDNLCGDVGMHSPVVYVNKPGVYRCSVTDNQKRRCYSKSITVNEGTVLYLQCANLKFCSLMLCSGRNFQQC